MRSPTHVARLLLAALAAGAAAPPGDLRAQADECQLSQGPTLNRQGDFLFISGRFRLDCSGGVVLHADSAVNIQSREEIFLIGNVSFQDTIKALEADWVHYRSAERYMEGRGDVLVTDLGTGSTVRGETLQYWRGGGPEGAETRVLVRGGRPHAVLYAADEAGQRPRPGPPEPGADTLVVPGAVPVAPDSAAPPTEVDADVIELLGEDRFRASGNVEIVRADLLAFGDRAEFDESTNRMELSGNARIDGETYDLTGGRIEAVLTDSGNVERVVAREQADLVSEDVRVQGPELRIFFDDGDPSRLIALGSRRVAPPDSVHAGPVRASATSEAFRLLADSIDALAHGQSLDSLHAVGHAYSEQVQDSLRAELPDLARTDWARGDTIRAYFAAVDSSMAPDSGAAQGADAVGQASAAPDSAGTRVALERMVVIGGGETGPAQTLYRERSGPDPSAPPDINYLVAASITVHLQDGEVRTVTAEGPVQGLQLQPRASGAAADSTAVPTGRSP